MVLLEWQNVTAGYELDAHWGPSWDHFVRSGYAWIGVSAQRVGVHGSPYYPTNNALKAWSPIRYGMLDLTDGGTVMDDSLCYDVFSQAAQAVQVTRERCRDAAVAERYDTYFRVYQTLYPQRQRAFAQLQESLQADEVV